MSWINDVFIPITLCNHSRSGEAWGLARLRSSAVNWTNFKMAAIGCRWYLRQTNANIIDASCIQGRTRLWDRTLENRYGWCLSTAKNIYQVLIKDCSKLQVVCLSCSFVLSGLAFTCVVARWFALLSLSLLYAGFSPFSQSTQVLLFYFDMF